MKIKLLYFGIFFAAFINVNAQDSTQLHDKNRHQIGINVFNSIINFPNRLELSYQLKNKDENSKINPVIIAGYNTGKSFISNTEKSILTIDNNRYNSQITNQYSNKSQYIKVGIDLITNRKENGYDDYAQFLIGYSNNTATNNVTVKGHYYDDFHYTDQTHFNAIILQAWYFSEFKIFEKIIGSFGLGMSGVRILHNSNPQTPMSEVGGGIRFFSLPNDIQYAISPTIKFSIHYKF